ncbi:hypothetical protein [Paenibacillus mucilaginosus]|uniref:hypothetical protein n=1 Tax=Paenibacillus mucilaginosus TaxID=61624 RepID=UPI003D2042C9
MEVLQIERELLRKAERGELTEADVEVAEELATSTNKEIYDQLHLFVKRSYEEHEALSDRQL